MKHTISGTDRPADGYLGGQLFYDDQPLFECAIIFRGLVGWDITPETRAIELTMDMAMLQGKGRVS